MAIHKKIGLKTLQKLNHFIPTQFSDPAILMLSYPRSGSSWAGKVIATSPSLAYLREPVTQPFLKLHGGERPIVDVESSKSVQKTYMNLSTQMFKGIPITHQGVVDNWRDFFPFNNSIKKQIFIKEVNPLAAQFYCDNFNVRLMVLLRHPAAVALSYYQRGWLEDHVESLGSKSQGCVWENFGKLYSTLMNETVKVASQFDSSQIIKYEDLVDSPLLNYQNLFEKLNILQPENFNSIIDEYCFSSADLTSSFNTRRNSKATSEKWKKTLSEENLKALRKGFNQGELSYYREDAEW